RMTMNHQNTFCMMGTAREYVEVKTFEEILQECANSCHQAVNEKHYPNAKRLRPNKWDCTEEVAKALGKEKHDCTEACVRGQVPGDEVGIEQPYRVEGGNLQTAGEPGSSPPPGGAAPDFVLHQPGNPLAVREVYDLKFPCPATNSPRWGSNRRGGLDQGET